MYGSLKRNKDNTTFEFERATDSTKDTDIPKEGRREWRRRRDRLWADEGGKNNNNNKNGGGGDGDMRNRRTGPRDEGSAEDKKLISGEPREIPI